MAARSLASEELSVEGVAVWARVLPGAMRAAVAAAAALNVNCRRQKMNLVIHLSRIVEKYMRREYIKPHNRVNAEWDCGI